MKKVFSNWCFSFFIVPLISGVFILGSYKTLYPLLTYDILPFRLSSIMTIKLLAALNALLIPFVVSRIYQMNARVLAISWIICTMLALIFDKGVYEGNPNAALALILLPYQMLAVAVTVALVVINKRKSVSA